MCGILRWQRTLLLSRSTNLESKLIDFFVLLKFQRTVSFGSLQPFTVRKIGDFPHFLSALASNNQFIIKLVKMWSGGTPHVVVGTCSVSSCEQCVMPACESKLVSRSSRKATVAKTVFVEQRKKALKETAVSDSSSTKQKAASKVAPHRITCLLYTSPSPRD